MTSIATAPGAAAAFDMRLDTLVVLLELTEKVDGGGIVKQLSLVAMIGLGG